MTPPPRAGNSSLTRASSQKQHRGSKYRRRRGPATHAPRLEDREPFIIAEQYAQTESCSGRSYGSQRGAESRGIIAQ